MTDCQPVYKTQRNTTEDIAYREDQMYLDWFPPCNQLLQKCSDYQTLQMRKHININEDTHNTFVQHTCTAKPANTNECDTIGRDGCYLPTNTSSSWARSQGLSGSEETLPYLSSFNFSSSATETRMNPSCFHSLRLTVLLYNLLYHYNRAY